MLKMSVTTQKRDPYLDDESDVDDFDEEYFNRTYRPLSNLPTPPPSQRDCSVSSSISLLEQDELFESALFGMLHFPFFFGADHVRTWLTLGLSPGPAVHLVNLIPPASSLITPSISTVHEILQRANLPLETVALAVCVLDSLNSKFSHSWRLSCPPAPVDNARRYTLPAQLVQLHIDSVRPEVIVLAALMIAVKFLEDTEENTQSYALRWGNDIWTSAQINRTEQCIMENLGYHIMPLWNRELIDDALKDMQRAGWQAVAETAPNTPITERQDPIASQQTRQQQQQHRRAMSTFPIGSKTVTFQQLLTPSDSPKSENVSTRGAETDREALQAAFAGYTFKALNLPSRTPDSVKGEGELHVPPHL